MDQTYVTAVMLTGGSNRLKLACAAVRSFMQQTWPYRKLLIINESKGKPFEYKVLDAFPELEDAREIHLELPGTLGERRNIGLAEADTDWIIQWDDDDWCHPKRMALQMAHRDEELANVLAAQVRFCFPTNSAYVYSNDPYGIAGTVLHYRPGVTYGPEFHGNEDSKFLLAHWESEHTRIDNSERPHLYLRFFHGENIRTHEHVMRAYAEPKWKGRWADLPNKDGYLRRKPAEYLFKILREEYGEKMDVMPWVGPKA